ncbi:hypothetical protein GQ607_013073 [Colletotrichum asianum]|uniref:Uncharacterized protein n=1 Tax=Colletotrichum asianum TaxID=702518 RepID=A0A8H3W200_9PEZI|nr:hypothetical protein GQ607_013073 [Colletotrichum asianum]
MCWTAAPNSPRLGSMPLIPYKMHRDTRPATQKRVAAWGREVRCC